MNLKTVNALMAEVEDGLNGGLAAADVFSKSSGMSVAGIRSSPKACALFNILCERIGEALAAEHEVQHGERGAQPRQRFIVCLGVSEYARPELNLEFAAKDAKDMMKALQEGARGVNAKAVVEIVSYYKKREFSSATEFECHVGTLMAGVALKGSYAK